MSNFIDYSRRRRDEGTPSPQGSIQQADHADHGNGAAANPFSDGEHENRHRGLSLGTVASNPYRSPFEQNYKSEQPAGGYEHPATGRGHHFDIEQVHTDVPEGGQHYQGQQNEPFFDPTFRGEF